MSTALFPTLDSAHRDENLMQNADDYPPQFEMRVSEIDDYISLNKYVLASITATDKFIEYLSVHKSILGATPATDKSMKYFSGTATARYYFYDDTQTKIQDEAKEVTDWYAVHSGQVSPPSPWKTGYLALTVGREHSNNSFIQYFQKHRILEEDAAIIPWSDNRVFFPRPSGAVSSTGNADLRHVYKNIILGKFSEKFDIVARREDNWNEREFKKPRDLALANAQQIVTEILDTVIDANLPLRTPFVSSNEDGNVTIVWYKGEHELHLEMTDDNAEYVRVWGINIDSEMDAGVPSKDNYLTLWDWLLHG